MKTTDPNVLIKRLKGNLDKKRDLVEKTTAANAQELAAIAKRNTPKDIGKLSQGITVPPLEIKGHIIKNRVVATEPYSAYVEFGTGDKVEIPPGLEDWAMQFYVNGQGWTPAQPFLYPALLQIKKQYIADLKAVLK